MEHQNARPVLINAFQFCHFECNFFDVSYGLAPIKQRKLAHHLDDSPHPKGPHVSMKNEGFTPPNMGEITPKNEGFGFPWHSVTDSGNFQIYRLARLCARQFAIRESCHTRQRWQAQCDAGAAPQWPGAGSPLVSTWNRCR